MPLVNPAPALRAEEDAAAVGLVVELVAPGPPGTRGAEQGDALEARLRRAERRKDRVAYVKAIQALRDREASLRVARRLGRLVNQANQRELAARIIESKLSANPFAYAMPATAAPVPLRVLVPA